MINVLTLFEQVAVLVLMIIPGWLLAKYHLVGDGIGKGVSNIVLYAAQPALIIAGFVSVDYQPDILIRMGWVFGLAFVILLSFYGIGCLVFHKAAPQKKSVLIFSTVFTNAGYMGIPLLCALFEDVYPEVAIYASVFVTAFNVLVWSLGAFIYTGNRKYISFQKMIFNPATLSTFVGLAVFLLSAIPAIRNSVIEPFIRQKGIVSSLIVSLKGLVAPLAMLLIGFRLPEIKIKDAIKDKYLYINLLFSLFVTPALAWGIVKLLALSGIYQDSLTLSVLLISAAAPAATATSMFAEKLEGDSAYAGLIVSLSSILCVASMPVVCLLQNI